MKSVTWLNSIIFSQRWDTGVRTFTTNPRIPLQLPYLFHLILCQRAIGDLFKEISSPLELWNPFWSYIKRWGKLWTTHFLHFRYATSQDTPILNPLNPPEKKHSAHGTKKKKTLRAYLHFRCPSLGFTGKNVVTWQNTQLQWLTGSTAML